MVEVDPTFLIAAGTAVIGITVIAVACRPSKESNASPKAGTSRKKKSKSTKSAASVTPLSAEPEPVVAVAKRSPAALPPQEEEKKTQTESHVPSTKPAPSQQREDKIPKSIDSTTKRPVEASVESVAVREPVSEQLEEEDASSKQSSSKKSKETPEQRAARLERQRLAKVKKSEEEAQVAAAALEGEQREASSSLRDHAIETEAPSDGWAVVGKVKSRKSKDEDSLPFTSAEKKLSVEEVAVSAASVDVVRGSVTIDAKKVGAVIGSKGATLHAIQNAAQVEITMPKDKDATGPVEVVVVGPAEGVKKGKKKIKLSY